MIIAIDFDGTCVTHEFPKVGRDINAVPVLKALADKGHQLILWTMRSDAEDPESQDMTIHCESGKYLTDAVKWFAANEIPLWGINSNPDQTSWTSSPKAYAQLYIDDAAFGAPLIHPEGERPHLDWKAVEDVLTLRGIL